jgi:hypothetical protein
MKRARGASGYDIRLQGVTLSTDEAAAHVQTTNAEDHVTLAASVQGSL